MQQQLSPKKYIQSRARALPIYRCFVSKDWRENDLANVFVLRRHVTGNITAGVYLIDLLCLGIKDTFFFFNETEDDLMDRIPMHLFMEIDYPLAHNIIFAGHDFAMDFEIQPHKDFSITKFILEEDTDAIPLIEVHTGDAAGMPHLMVDAPGQSSEALAKLKKHAGEGHYHYTVGGASMSDDAEADESDDVDQFAIDDFGEGDILPLDAMYITSENLLDDEKVKGRSPGEQITLRLEMMLRVLRRLRPELFGFEWASELPEYQQYLSKDTAPALNGSDPADNASEKDQEIVLNERVTGELVPLLENDEEALHAKVSELLTAYEGNMPAAATLFEILLINKRIAAHVDLIGTMQAYAARYPYARLILALGFLRYPDVLPGDHSDIYQSSDIRELFPDYPVFHKEELCLYWIIRLMLAAKAEDIPKAIRFYALIAATEAFSLQLAHAQLALYSLIDPILKAEVPRENVGE